MQTPASEAAAVDAVQARRVEVDGGLVGDAVVDQGLVQDRGEGFTVLAPLDGRPVDLSYNFV